MLRWLLAPRKLLVEAILEIIKGNETPEDLIVLLQWAQENSVLLARPSGTGDGWSVPVGENRGVSSLDRTGLVDDTGEHHSCDVIIYSTGFKATELLASVDIRGRDGRQLQREWHGDDARAYLGMSVPGFPNLFIMYGPNTNLAHGGSLFFHAECQARHIMMLLREMTLRQAHSVEVRREPFEQYNQRVDEAHAKMVWTHGGMRNWYKNSKGRVVTNSPWKLVEYWDLTRALDPEVYAWGHRFTGP